MNKLLPSLLFIVVSAGLTACGGSSESVVITDPPEPPRPTEAPDVNQATAFEGPLFKAGETDVSRFIRNGIYSATLNGQNRESLDASPSPVSSQGAFSQGFSTTNTQEQGVDEADRVEYDGNTLFLATYPQWFDEEQSAKIRVLQRNDDFSLTEITQLTVSEDRSNVDGLFLANDRLAVLGSDFPYYPLVDIAIAPWAEPEGKVVLKVYDTADTNNIAEVNDIEIDGWLMSSRRIENNIYLATTYVPSVEGLEPGDSTKEVMLQNYLKILDTPMSDLMPRISVNGAERNMNAPEDCFIPSQASENDGFAQIITVTRINMQQADDIQSMCMSAFAFMLYMSEQNIYLASSIEEQTGFHKIALDDLSYQAFGAVPGLIGWRGNPNFRVDEENGLFRVLSSDYSERDPVHQLSVLRQDGDALNIVAQLPNEDQPEAIGKPGEDVYAVRFLGDKGYVVTFEQIDPLYVIDFSVGDAPFIAGSLEIPGFSSYLHPMENGYLLGVGQQVSVENLPGTGEEPVLPPVTEGMKVSLFDVTDPTMPMEIASIVKEQAYTPVEFEYKALAVLNTDGRYQFALPMEEWGISVGEENPAETSLWGSRNSLLLLEADTAAAEVDLTQIDQLIAQPEANHYIYSGNDRSIIHGQHVYYINGNQVWHGLWQAENELDGPY